MSDWNCLRKVIPPEQAATGKTTPSTPAPPKSWSDDFFWSNWFKKPQKIDIASAGPLFKRIDTGQRLLDRLTTAPINLPEADALNRLHKLFVGPKRGKAPLQRRLAQ